MKLSRFIAAPPADAFAAFADERALTTWLPPNGMTAAVRDFDPRAGGGYRMTLTFAEPGGHPVGKTTAESDEVAVRFVEWVPAERIVQVARFTSEDPAFAGEMRMTWRFAPSPGGTEVSVEVKDAPPGISEADHEAGIRSSLENLARWLSAP
jgi:uncharacterized protein YndB with AHSA1/START domain